MSKMAAYNAGEGRRTVGPTTRVPIADFLVNNGFIAARTSQNRNEKQSHDANATSNDPLNSRAVDTHLNMGGPSSVAPIADMSGVNGLAPLNHVELSCQGSTSRLSHNHLQANGGPITPGSSVSMGVRSTTSPRDAKPACTPGPFSNMTPEPGLMPSIERDSKEDGQVAALRYEVSQLRSMFQNSIGNVSLIGDNDIYEVRGGPGAGNNPATDLHQRVGQLEGMVHAIQNVSLVIFNERVVALETIVDQLNEKVGNGCDAEVAKMREVFGSLREAMTRVGNFL